MQNMHSHCIVPTILRIFKRPILIFEVPICESRLKLRWVGLKVSHGLQNRYESVNPVLFLLYCSDNRLQIDYQTFIVFLKELQDALQELQANVSSEKENARGSEIVLAHEHLSFFLSFLQSEYSSTTSELASLLEHGEITFDLLWAILKPRSFLYTRCNFTGEPRSLRLLESSKANDGNGKPRRQLTAEYVDYNVQYGSAVSNDNKFGPLDRPPKFGLVAGLFPQVIENFKGARKISSLPIYPIQFYPQHDELRNLLISRGRKWAILQGGMHYMQYKKMGSSLERELKLLVNFSSFRLRE